MKINYSSIRELDIANGPGVRVTLFVSGCTHNCEGCFNKLQQNFNHGNKFDIDIENYFINLIKNDLIAGVNILGGEPLQQDDTLLNLLKRIKKETNKSIWLWTGYRLDEIPKGKLEVLEYIDTLIDGRFELSEKDLSLKYRGSKNQNIYIKDQNRFFTIKNL